MKKVFLIATAAVFVLAFTSCKKDYTCDCTGTDAWTYSYTMTDVTKKDAEASCDAANATWSSFGASCSLK